jgi:hypothetical protein
MLRTLVVMLLLVAATARAQQEGAAAPARPEAARKTRIAVLDVQYAGVGDRKTVEGLSALLASEVARRPNLAVLAGADLRALVGFERQKALLGCTESSCIAELAGALGVAYLISSEVSKVGTTWLLSLALLDAGKATALSRLTRKAYSDDQLVEETSTAVDELLKALPGAGQAQPQAAPAARADPAAAPGEAGAGKPPPGFHRHDGFYLGVQLGFGGLKSTGGNLELSGTSGSFAVALGFSIVDNLVLFGQVFDDVAVSPKVTLSGQPTALSGTGTQAMIAYGVGLAYYLMPINGYLAVTAGVGDLNYEVTGGTAGNQTLTTQKGPVFRFSVGKEWWVSTDWGLGLSLNLVKGSMKDQGTNPETFSSTAFSVAFSATYN